MAFSGKATYNGTTWTDEKYLDVSDIVALLSMTETPLLNALGDPINEATEIKHEWLEDSLNAVTDALSNSATATATGLEVNNVGYFRIGDIIRVGATDELMLVTSIGTTSIIVTRGYSGTTAAALADNAVLNIIGNAALEGADLPTSMETFRTRKSNYTQIFQKSISLSGTEQAISHIGVESEFDHQVALRIKEMLRELERTVLNGGQPAATPQGSASVRRSMDGIFSFLTTNVTDYGGTLTLTEARLNALSRLCWDQGGRPDIIVCNAFNKRNISAFVTPANRYYQPGDRRFSAVFGVYESDFGVQRVILTPNVDTADVLLLESSKIQVKPLRGRSFHFEPMGKTGDTIKGQVVGEYTLELMCEAAHARAKGTTTS